MKLMLVLLLTIPFFAQAWVRVGNSGEGLPTPDGYDVRDLVEAGTAKNPWFGSSSNPLLKRKLEKSNFARQFKSELDLLARKLTDIENSKPGLGYMILDALQMYGWVLTNDNFSTPETNSAPFPNEPMYMPLASRGPSTIFICDGTWQLLSTEHRVALIIHEMVYALAKVDCPSGLCRQEAASIRPLVGNLFAEKPSLNISAIAEQVLNIEELSRNENSPFEFAFSVEKNGSSIWNQQSKVSIYDFDKITNMFQDFCGRIYDDKGLIGKMKVRGIVLQTKYKPYYTQIGSGDEGLTNQTSVHVRSTPIQRGFKIYPSQTAKACMDHLKNQFFQY